MIALSDRAFVVSFAEIDRWDVSYFRAVEWHWSPEHIQPLGSALRRKQIPVASDGDITAIPIIEKISFGGVLSVTSEEERAGYKGRLFWAETGDLVYSKIRAKQGSLCIVPPEVEKVAVSPEYPVYSVDASIADANYLALVLRSDAFRRHLEGMAHGSSSKTRIVPEELERQPVPLPPLDIQRAIVDYWHSAQREESAARQALRQVTADLDAALRNHFHARQSNALDALRSRCLVVDWRDMDAWDLKSARAAAYRHAGSDLVPMGDFAEDATELAYPKREPEHEWPVYGVNNKEGVVFNQHQKGEDFNAPYKRIQEGWFFHNPTRSAVGSLGMVPPVPEDAITSPEYQVWRMKEGVTDVLRDYVAVLITTPLFINLVRIHRVGAVKQRLYVENLLSIHVPRVPLEEQRQFADRRTAALERIKLSRERLTVVRAQVSEMILGTRPIPTAETLLEEYHDLVDLKIMTEDDKAEEESVAG